MQCGYLDESELDVCIEHTSFHLCAPDGTCDVELDQSTTEDALYACDAAVRTLDDFGCYLMNAWGSMPQECDAVFAVDPS